MSVLARQPLITRAGPFKDQRSASDRGDCAHAGHVGEYLLAHHAWTFAGSGTFSVKPGFPFVFESQNNPLCRDIRSDHVVCDFYSATFERIFAELVHPKSRVTETACESAGATACLFEIVW